MSIKNELRRLAGGLMNFYLNHRNFKAHGGVLVPLPPGAEEVRPHPLARDARRLRRSLKELAGVKLSASEAYDEWPRVLEHKWYLGERLGRDVGLRVAAVDYFENVRRARGRARLRTNRGGLPPRLPMMMPLSNGY